MLNDAIDERYEEIQEDEGDLALKNTSATGKPTDWLYEVKSKQSPLFNLFRKFMLQNIPVQISISLNHN